jgi:hypothetical protein
MEKRKDFPLIPLDDWEKEEDNLVPITRIGTETVLTQYPFHRIAKRSTSKIEITKLNDRGKVMAIWNVSPSREFGEPGPLAYKIDTLLINRLIDEARPMIPEVIRLGSLREIAQELGLGGDTEKVKKALHQNASSYITASIEYRGNDGEETFFEFGASRYEVIFYGKKLPDGRRADSTYIVLHRTYREFLSHAKTRPLDYDYLKSLPPAAQRLYELLSFQIFAAIKNGNPRARYLYSDLCKYAPLTRHREWEQVKKQLYKIHRPHRESGYVSKIEFEDTADEQGKPDWIMWYTPGRKAKREYKEFTTRRIEQKQIRPQLLPPPPPRQERELNAKQRELLTDLLAYIPDEGICRNLVQQFPDQVAVQLEALPNRNLESVENIPGFLVAAIKQGYSQPPMIEKRQAKKKAQEERQGKEAHKNHFYPAYRKYLAVELKRLERSRPKAYAAFEREFEELSSVVAQSYDGPSDLLRIAVFEQFVQENRKLDIFSFWEWDGELNPQPFKGLSD